MGGYYDTVLWEDREEEPNFGLLVYRKRHDASNVGSGVRLPGGLPVSEWFEPTVGC